MKNRLYLFLISIITIIDGLVGLIFCWFNKPSNIVMNFLYFISRKRYDNFVKNTEGKDDDNR